MHIEEMLRMVIFNAHWVYNKAIAFNGRIWYGLVIRKVNYAARA